MVLFTTQKCESVVGMNCQCRLKEIPPSSFNLLLSPLLSVGAVVLEQDSAAAQQYSRQGCPTGLRADLWALILNSTNQPQVLHTQRSIKTTDSRREFQGSSHYAAGKPRSQAFMWMPFHSNHLPKHIQTLLSYMRHCPFAFPHRTVWTPHEPLSCLS